MSESALPRPPEVLEGFRVGALRRSAGALAIHAATDRLDLAVDLHLVRADAVPGGAEAFVSVLRRATEVRHESLLTYVTGGRAGDLLFAAAKTVDAPAIDDVLGRGGALDEDRVLAIGVAVAGVLAALERSGLRHGDLTPRRVLLPGRGQVAVQPPRLVPVSAAPRNDRYQSPEEARGAAGDVRSDLFVLGLILAEALTGAPLLRVPAAEARRILADGRFAADLPRARPATRAVVTRLLAVDPAARFATAAAAEAALRAAAAGEEPPAAAPIPVAVAPAPIPVLTEERPETAPIPAGLVQQVMAAAAAGAPAAPPATDAPDPSLVRRPPGRLYLKGRLGETLLEIDETIHVGKPAEAIDLGAHPEPFPEAEFVVERGMDADVLRVVRPPVRVNGAIVTTHTLRQGDKVDGMAVHGRYEASQRQALRATGFGGGPPPDPKPARILMAVSLVIALAGIGLSLPRFTGARDAADEAERSAAESSAALQKARAPAAGPAAPADDPSVLREQSARAAYDAARDWARKNPADAAGAAAKLREVAERHDGTAHGALARAESADAERRARAGGGGGDVDRVVADAKKQSDEGRLDAALKALRGFAESHPGTIAGERASAAATQLENEVLGRFESDAARAERALAQKEWTAAYRIASAMRDYAPASLVERVNDIFRRVEAGRTGGAAQTPPKAPETPKPPPDVAKPPEAPKPPETPTGPTGDREKDAETAFRAAKKLMESGKDAEAIDALLAFLSQWKDTRAGASHDVEARSRISVLAQGPAGVTKLFRGKCEKLEKGRWRVSYDFQDPEQMKDFRDVEAFEAPPRAEWKLVDGGARAKGAGAFVLDATFQTDQLVTTVTVSPERAHDLGVAFVDAAEPRRFYLFTLQNTFFTLGKGDAAKVFEENAIVLFGPGMWRDTPPGQIGFVRKCGSAEPTIRPAESAPIKCGKSEGQVWMRMEGGRQISGSAYGDVKLEFKGIEPAVFVLNSSGSFDDFIVEGTPDPEWVAGRWRAILSGL